MQSGVSVPIPIKTILQDPDVLLPNFATNTLNGLLVQTSTTPFAVTANLLRDRFGWLSRGVSPPVGQIIRTPISVIGGI